MLKNVACLFVLACLFFVPSIHSLFPLINAAVFLVCLTSQLSVTQVLLVSVIMGTPHWAGGPAAVVTSVGSEYGPY